MKECSHTVRCLFLVAMLFASLSTLHSQGAPNLNRLPNAELEDDDADAPQPADQDAEASDGDTSADAVRPLVLSAYADMQKVSVPEGGIALRMTRPVPTNVPSWHFRTGTPFGPGALKTTDAVRLARDGRNVPVQSEVLATWGPPGTEPGNYVKWLGLDFTDSVTAGDQQEYRLFTGKGDGKQAGLTVKETDRQITVNNGRLELVFNKPSRIPNGFNLFESVKLDGRTVLQAEGLQGAYMVDGTGQTYWAQKDAGAVVNVEMAGPLACVVRAEGWFVGEVASGKSQVAGEPKERPKGGFCRFVTRVYIAADQPDVRVQHTFILTEDSSKTTWRDIGIALPVEAGAAATYGGVGGAHAGHTYLLQESWDKFTVNRVASDGSVATIGSGEKPEGWVAVGNLTVGFRDFWQNFPKELEVASGKWQVETDKARDEGLLTSEAPDRLNTENRTLNTSSLLLHLWPAHGIPRMETTETLNDGNTWRLPFVHSGKDLDFRIPECLRDKKTFKELAGAGGYVENMYLANAMGMSRTHEFSVGFDAAQAADRQAAFQANPHVLPDPVYVCATRVLGRMVPSDPQQRPLVEHYLNHGMKWVIRVKESFGGFGMWNYSDTHTYYRASADGVMPQYRRLWAATHYNSMRPAWWLYVRGGDPVILDHARRQTGHIRDVDVCHWENEFFSREHQPTDNVRKAVGGLCDYKGVVHWHRGDDNAYNACVDYLLYDYYLCGDRRSWDVALEHGYYVKETGHQTVNRECAGQVDTYVELYKATWDPAVGKKLATQVRRIMVVSNNLTDLKVSWTPWLPRYWELTQAPEVKDFLLKRLDAGGAQRLNDSAYAYYMTGDKDHAVDCAKSILQASLKTIVRNDEYDGLIGRFVHNWINDATDIPLALEAASQVRLSLADFQPAEWHNWAAWNVTSSSVYDKMAETAFGGAYPWPKDLKAGGHRITAYIYHDGRAKTLRLGCVQQAAPGTQITVYGPDGGKVTERFSEGYWRVIVIAAKSAPYALRKTWPPNTKPGDKIILEGKPFTVDRHGQVELEERPYHDINDAWALASRPFVLGPAHPAGFYKIVWDGGGFFTPVPVLPPEEKVWIATGSNSTMCVNGFQFFHVPETCERFELSFLPDYDRQRFYNKLAMASGAVLNPDAETVAPISCGLETDPQTVTVDVPPQHRGKTWAIAGSDFTVVSMKGVPPYISPSYKTFEGAPFAPP